MEGLGVAASVIAVVQISTSVADLFLQYYKDVKHAKDDIARLRERVIQLQTLSKDVENLLSSPKGTKLRTSRQLLAAVSAAKSQLEDLRNQLRPKTARQAFSRLGLHSLRWPFQSRDVEKHILNLNECVNNISQALQVDQITIILDLDQKAVLKQLPIARGASFDSHAEEHNPTCLPNTRVELLHKIQEWADNPDAEPIFWLNGMAGTGKSTISRTVAQSFAQKGKLGASFFFSRGEADRGDVTKLFTTIAADIALKIPLTTVHIKDALDADPSIKTKNLSEQFNKLFQQPLARVAEGAGRDDLFIIVVDALDECERDDDIKRVIHLFSHIDPGLRKIIKVFLTSRPELPIRLGFSANPSAYRDIVLHEIHESLITRDITTYLNYELAKIRSEYNDSVSSGRQLSSSWPNKTDVQSLASVAVPLFIVAATVCRFVSDRRCGVPDEQLQEIIEYQSNKQGLHFEQLGMTYMPVLNKLIKGLTPARREKVCQEFQQIVGTIILLATPLSVSTIARLLGIPQKKIEGRLDMLHSVLSIPPSPISPIRLLHLSFREFLIDPEKRETNSFWIDESETHKYLAERCLQLLSNGDTLKKDICNLGQPGISRDEIEQQTIDARLPPEIQYACQYWVIHWKESKYGMKNGDNAHCFLTQHLLHWLEALSLMGLMSDSLSMIGALLSLLDSEDGSTVAAFLRDTQRVIQSQQATVHKYPLQVYYSAVIFAPEQSLVRKTFWNESGTWLSRPPRMPHFWDACLQTLEGHTARVESVAFSPDSKQLASGSDDSTIKLWDVATGACTLTLEGHTGRVRSIAFSPDSKQLASGSDDITIKLWDVTTGACTLTLKGHTDWVRSIVFSPDSKQLASGSDDRTIKLWDVATGACTSTIEGHTDRVRSIVFSPDSKQLASGSGDKTIKLWDVATGVHMATLKDLATKNPTFDTNSIGLVTEYGWIQPTSLHLPSTQNAHICLDISEDGKWILKGSRRILWLPSDYRPSSHAVIGMTVAIGCTSGRVIMLTASC